MTTESISKQQRLEEKEGIDWISTLPDSILLHILSFLPTKTSVATMPLVSRRWRYLWKDLQVFDFYNEGYQETDLERFAIFVKAVLTLRRNRDIRRLRYYDNNRYFMLTCPASINMCIRDAMGPHLEELHLNIEHADIWVVDIPSTLFDCINLVSLKLCGSIDLNVQHSSARIYFPSLKKLYLHIENVDSIDALLTGCPILETLDIINTPPLDPSLRFRVPPSLKRLKYIDYYSFTSTYIDIDAPCLKYLSITKKGILDIAGNMQRVVEAYIDVSSLKDNESVKPLLNLLCAISETKHLTLCSSTTKLLLCAPIQDFPVFRCLLHLDLELPSFNPKLLAKVIENCHVLQVFVIMSHDHKKEMPIQLWEPESRRIPNCLVSHLTSIHIKRYYGLEDELTFLEYILQNALVLKTMIIKSHSSMGLEEKLSILKKVINIPRGSNLCKVEFD